MHDEECKTIIDGIWRIVIGSGAVPALLAIIFRFFLYDCGLYTLEVKNKPGNAFRDTQRVYGQPEPMHNGAELGSPIGGPQYSQQPMPVQFSLQDLKTYFITEKNWYYLLGKYPALISDPVVQRLRYPMTTPGAGHLSS
jgi:PHS family inorganic phosphate transporter-like MFS transporter